MTEEDIIKSELIKQGKLSGKIMAFLMESNENVDIDNHEDWIKAKNRLL